MAGFCNHHLWPMSTLSISNISNPSAILVMEQYCQLFRWDREPGSACHLTPMDISWELGSRLVIGGYPSSNGWFICWKLIWVLFKKPLSANNHASRTFFEHTYFCKPHFYLSPGFHNAFFSLYLFSIVTKQKSDTQITRSPVAQPRGHWQVKTLRTWTFRMTPISMDDVGVA